MSARTKQSKSKVTSLQTRLKYRQRVLHTIKALVRTVNLLLVSGFIYLIFLLWNHETFKIQEIEYMGLSEYGTGFISKLQIEEMFIDNNLFFTDPDLVRESLYNKRIFREIVVYRSLFPAKITIKFIERTPYISITDNSTEKKLTVDNYGVVLPNINNALKNQEQIYTTDKINNFQLTKNQMEVISILEKVRLKHGFEDIGSFNITDTENIYLNTPDNKVLLGNTEHIINKLNTYPLLEKLAESNKNDLDYIDVRYWKNPVLRLKKDKSGEK